MARTDAIENPGLMRQTSANVVADRLARVAPTGRKSVMRKPAFLCHPNP